MDVSKVITIRGSIVVNITIYFSIPYLFNNISYTNTNDYLHKFGKKKHKILFFNDVKIYFTFVSFLEVKVINS